MSKLDVLFNYQYRTRNAKIYKTHNLAENEYGVLMYEAIEGEEKFRSYPTIEDAKACAKLWLIDAI